MRGNDHGPLGAFNGGWKIVTDIVNRLRLPAARWSGPSGITTDDSIELGGVGTPAAGPAGVGEAAPLCRQSESVRWVSACMGL